MTLIPACTDNPHPGYCGVHSFCANKPNICGLAPPLSLIETDPASNSPTPGDHLTLMLQEPPVATLASQEFVWEKGPEIAMPLMFSVVCPTLVSVAVCDVMQTQWGTGKLWTKQAKRRLVGESATSVPVPLRETVCGLPGALSVTDSVPLRFPICLGLKATLTVQLAPAANELPQVWVCAKSPALVPVIAIPLIVKVVVPTLVSVTVFAGLDVPRTTAPRFRLVSESLAVVPTPVRPTFCGLPAALSVTLRVAVRVPLAVGLIVTLMLQLAPAANELPQVWVCTNPPHWFPQSQWR